MDIVERSDQADAGKGGSVRVLKRTRRYDDTSDVEDDSVSENHGDEERNEDGTADKEEQFEEYEGLDQDWMGIQSDADMVVSMQVDFLEGAPVTHQAGEIGFQPGEPAAQQIEDGSDTMGQGDVEDSGSRMIVDNGEDEPAGQQLGGLEGMQAVAISGQQSADTAGQIHGATVGRPSGAIAV